MKKFAVANSKGGVGKTFLAVNLAVAFTEMGMKAALVDLDPKGWASGLFGRYGERPSYVLKGLKLFPASPDLPTKEKLLPSARGFDVMVVDTPPGSGDYVLRVLEECVTLIVPFTPDVFDLAGAVETVKSAVESGINVELLGAVLNKVKKRTVATKKVKMEMGNIFGKKTFKTEIPESEAARRARILGKPLMLAFPDSAPAKAVRKLAKEVLERWEKL